MDNAPLHQQVKAVRESRRLSIPELADRAGVAYNTVSRVERGGHVSTESLDAILSALSCELRLVRRRMPLVSTKKATKEVA